MTVKHLFCWSVLLCACLAPLAPGGDAKGGKDDTKKLQGTWKPVMAELGGKALPDEFVKNLTLMLADGKYLVTAGTEKDLGTWKSDPTKEPKTLDIMGTAGPNKGKTILAIYELKGDTLRVCYDLSGKARPKEFKTEPNTVLFLAEYKRQKP